MIIITEYDQVIERKKGGYKYRFSESQIMTLSGRKARIIYNQRAGGVRDVAQIDGILGDIDTNGRLLVFVSGEPKPRKINLHKAVLKILVYKK